MSTYCTMAAEPTPAQNGFSAKCLLAATVAFFGAGVVAFTAGQLHGSLYAVSSTATTRPFTTARVPTRLGVQVSACAVLIVIGLCWHGSQGR